MGDLVIKTLLQTRCPVDTLQLSCLSEGSSFYESIEDEKCSSGKGFGLP